METKQIIEGRFKSTRMCSDCHCHYRHLGIVPRELWWDAINSLVFDITYQILHTWKPFFLSSKKQSTYVKAFVKKKMYPPATGIFLACWTNPSIIFLVEIHPHICCWTGADKVHVVVLWGLRQEGQYHHFYLLRDLARWNCESEYSPSWRRPWFSSAIPPLLELNPANRSIHYHHEEDIWVPVQSVPAVVFLLVAIRNLQLSWDIAKCSSLSL